MTKSLSPGTEHPTASGLWPAGVVAVALLAASLLALLLAPALMPDSYSWLQHTTSESAAQGVRGAWLARLGFLLFGLTVLWMSGYLRQKWSRPVRWLHGTFGIFMIATAAFSTRPWLPGSAYDPVEDALHSVTATALGFAFAIGAALRLRQRGGDRLGLGIDLAAILAAVAIPLAMSAFPDWDGLLQRGMFGIAYIWYGFELLYQGDR